MNFIGATWCEWFDKSPPTSLGPVTLQSKDPRSSARRDVEKKPRCSFSSDGAGGYLTSTAIGDAERLYCSLVDIISYAYYC